MSNDPDKNTQTGIAQGSKGIKDFFRKRKKSSGSGFDGAQSPEDGAEGDVARNIGYSRQYSTPLPTTSRVKSPITASADDVGTRQAYGNYLTISGTGANILRDLFNKRYRSSARGASPGAGSQDGTSTDSRSRKVSQVPVFRFRPKKESIKEEDDGHLPHEEKSPTLDGEALSKSTDGRGGLKDYFRSRHKSVPVNPIFDTDARSKTGSPVPLTTPGGRMRTFFDSFRQRTKSESVSLEVYPGDLAGANAINYYKVSGGGGSGRKKKKFKVTKLSSGSGDKDSQFGPEEFVELYRSRANSDPRLEARLKARESTRMRKVRHFQAHFLASVIIY